MNNKKLLLIIGGIVLLLFIIGGVLVFSTRSSNDSDSNNSNVTTGENIGTLKPSDIGLKLVLSSNNQKVRVVVDDISNIKSLEYDISYDADIPASELAPGETGGKVERGFSDEAKITSSQSRYESKDFDLGSCSRNVCRYDTGVEEVRIIMKVIKKDGKVYEVKDSVEV